MVYVDDFLSVGPRACCHCLRDGFTEIVENIDPQLLSIDADLNFLRLSIRQLATGLLLHQHRYTEELLSEHASPNQGEPERFYKQAPGFTTRP